MFLHSTSSLDFALPPNARTCLCVHCMIFWPDPYKLHFHRCQYHGFLSSSSWLRIPRFIRFFPQSPNGYDSFINVKSGWAPGWDCISVHDHGRGWGYDCCIFDLVSLQWPWVMPFCLLYCLLGVKYEAMHCRGYQAILSGGERFSDCQMSGMRHCMLILVMGHLVMPLDWYFILALLPM